MSSSPWEWLCNGDEDVATPSVSGQCQDAPLLANSQNTDLTDGGRIPSVRALWWWP
jgi:hypothetical protein